MNSSFDKHITAQSAELRTSSAEKIRMFILFLIQPFFLLLLSFRNYRKDWAKNALWLFVIFYGLTFAISPHSSADSVRYAQRLADMHSAGWDLNLLLYQLYAVDGFRDLYSPLATFLVSRFTDNYNILFGVFGVAFFFYSRNIWMLIGRVEHKLALYGILFLEEIKMKVLVKV